MQSRTDSVAAVCAEARVALLRQQLHDDTQHGQLHAPVTEPEHTALQASDAPEPILDIMEPYDEALHGPLRRAPEANAAMSNLVQSAPRTKAAAAAHAEPGHNPLVPGKSKPSISVKLTKSLALYPGQPGIVLGFSLN